MNLVSQPHLEVATSFVLIGVATWVAVWEVATWILASRPRNPTVGRNKVTT